MDQEETVTIQPLTGITVVDVSNFILGPLAGSMLGDLGADVIKVERPGGDLMRHLVTAAGIDVSLPDGGSCTVEMMNRNKRSIVIDFSTPQGKALLLALVQDTDVFIENFRPGVLDRLGLGYDDLLKINPRLIYAGASGHGRRGPEAGRPAFDSTGQARSGVMWASGSDGDPPNWSSLSFSDVMGGNMLAYRIVAAITARARTGVGQRVDVAHMLTSMWLASWAIGTCAFHGLDEWPRNDRRKAGDPLFNLYECGDGEWITLGSISYDRDWPDLCKVLEAPALLADPRFQTQDAVRKHAAELIVLLDHRFALRPRAEWEERLRAKPNLVFDRVQRIGDLPTDPAVLANGYLVDVEHPRYGTVKMPSYPVTFKKTPATIRRVAPEVGQHTAEILKERLAYTDGQIADLVSQGVIG